MTRKPASLRFEVLRLKDGPETYDLEEPPSVLELEDDPEYTFTDPVRLHLKLKLVSDTVLMSGTVEATARAACSRCLEPVAIPLKADVNLVFMTDERLLDADRYPELQEDNTRWYDGELIHPAETLRELLLLELPTFPTCDNQPGLACKAADVPLVFGAAAEKEPEREEEEKGASFGAQLKKLRRDLGGSS